MGVDRLGERSSLPVRDCVGDFRIETPDPQLSRIVWEVQFTLIDESDGHTADAIRAFLHDGAAQILAKHRPYAIEETKGVQTHIADADKEARAGTVSEQVRNTPPAGAWNETSSDLLVEAVCLSLHAESRRGVESRRVLVDFGFTPTALNNNIDLLGVAPSQLNALVLSHGHYDHFGGLVGFLRRNSGKIEAGLPFYVGGEDCFCSREWVGPPERNYGVLDRMALRKAQLRVTYAPGPAVVADHGFCTGKVALRSFEKPLSPTSMRIGVDHGLGCFADRLPKQERTKISVPDKFRHEIATCFNVKNRGLVVLTSCSHRGVINTLRQAQAVSGIDKVHAVIGGFHLAPYPEDYARRTIAALKSMDVQHVIPLHCTGELFYEMAKAEIPDRLIRAYTGTRLAFGVSEQRS